MHQFGRLLHLSELGQTTLTASSTLLTSKHTQSANVAVVFFGLVFLVHQAGVSKLSDKKLPAVEAGGFRLDSAVRWLSEVFHRYYYFWRFNL
jgi:hypothetical protein